jgi:hypothetical protein
MYEPDFNTDIGVAPPCVDEPFNHQDTVDYINHLKTAQPDNNYDYSLVLYDAKDVGFEEAPITFNFNSDSFGDSQVAELVLNYKYNNVNYKLFDRKGGYKRHLKDKYINKRAYENFITVDFCMYDKTMLIYRTKNNKSFSTYLQEKKTIQTILNKKLPNEINILQFDKNYN